MTSYTAIANGDIDQDSPVTQPLVTALRDNPIAIAEGSSGAPKVDGVALDNLFLGTATVDSTTPQGFVGLDRVKEVFSTMARVNTAARTFEIRFTNDGGGTWGAYQSAGIATSLGTTASYFGTHTMNLETGAYTFIRHEVQSTSSTAGLTSGTYTVPTGCNGFQIRSSGAGDTLVFGSYVISGVA